MSESFEQIRFLCTPNEICQDNMKTIYGKTVIILCLIIKSLDCTPVCAPRQVQRLSPSGELICCNTVICQQGQKYDFCDQNQGNDTCSNCPEGMYHLDKINTAVMSMMLDPCIQRPTCEQPEVVLVNGRCICDRSRGYYGYDENNCLLAEVQCSSPGFELSNTGKCEPCQEEYFKSEASSDYICQPKSRCPDSQDIANNGSATTDRTCRAKQSIERHVQQLENKNNTRLTRKERREHPNSFPLNIMGAVVPVLTIVIIVILLKSRRSKGGSICCELNFTSFPVIIKCYAYKKPKMNSSSEDVNPDIEVSGINPDISEPHETCAMIDSKLKDINCEGLGSEDDKVHVYTTEDHIDSTSLGTTDHMVVIVETPNARFTNFCVDGKGIASHSRSFADDLCNDEGSHRSSKENNKTDLSLDGLGTYESEGTAVLTDEQSNYMIKSKTKTDQLNIDASRLCMIGSKVETDDEHTKTEITQEKENLQCHHDKEMDIINKTRQMSVTGEGDIQSKRQYSSECNKGLRDNYLISNNNANSKELSDNTDPAQILETTVLHVKNTPKCPPSKQVKKVPPSLTGGLLVIEDESLSDHTCTHQMFRDENPQLKQGTGMQHNKITKDTEETLVKTVVKPMSENNGQKGGYGGFSTKTKPNVAKVRPTKIQTDNMLTTTTTQTSIPESPDGSRKMATSVAPRPADSAISNEEP